jgi:hypothetical protein
MDYERGWTRFREGADVVRSPDNEHTIITGGCCFAGLDLRNTHPNSGHATIQGHLFQVLIGDLGYELLRILFRNAACEREPVGSNEALKARLRVPGMILIRPINAVVGCCSR